MIDSLVAPHASKIVGSIADNLAQKGISATQVTIAGFALGLIGCFCVGMQQYIPGLFLMLASQACDGLDGAIARKTTVTERGAFLDTLCDFTLYAMFPFFFILSGPEHALGGAFVLLSYALMMSAYLLHCQYTKKGIPDDSVAGGLVGHTEMILFISACCIFPALFSAFAAIFGMVCMATAILRALKILKFLRRD